MTPADRELQTLEIGLLSLHCPFNHFHVVASGRMGGFSLANKAEPSQDTKGDIDKCGGDIIWDGGYH